MSKDDFNYFDAFKKQAAYSQEMALNLASAIERNELGSKDLMNAMHTFENDADAINHIIQQHLVSDFVVPYERNGINELANSLDDVSDAVEDIAIKAYMLNISTLPIGGPEMIKHLANAVSHLNQAVKQIGSIGKKSEVVMEHCVKVQSAESDCDPVYIESVRKINNSDASFEQRHNDTTILAAIERAVDTVEDAAEIIESIVAENA